MGPLLLWFRPQIQQVEIVYNSALESSARRSTFRFRLRPAICYVWGRPWGSVSLTRFGDRRLARLAMIAALAAAFALAGCGRKGPLDAPPSAALVAPAP